jgi:pyruvate formate lyase activating enzyme
MDGVHLKAYGEVCAMAVEPIEKKPIYHFRPGSKVLSVGFSGCNLDCNFCQNAMISQKDEWESTTYSPASIANLALQKKCDGICLTYNEPTIHYEFIMDLADWCKAHGVYLSLKTNGCLEIDPWRDICSVVDAVNIDWKGDSGTYGRICGWPIDFARIVHGVINRNIRYAVDTVHTEISIPVSWGLGFWDYIGIIDLLEDWDKTPIHLLKVFPSNRCDSPSTKDDILLSMRTSLQKVFPFVYIENLFTEDGNKSRQTHCPDCQKLLVSRDSLVATTHFDSPCPKCLSYFKLA